MHTYSRVGSFDNNAYINQLITDYGSVRGTQVKKYYSNTVRIWTGVSTGVIVLISSFLMNSIDISFSLRLLLIVCVIAPIAGLVAYGIFRLRPQYALTLEILTSGYKVYLKFKSKQEALEVKDKINQNQ